MAPQFKPARMRKVPRCQNCGVRPRARMSHTAGGPETYEPFCQACSDAAWAALNKQPLPAINHTEPR